MNQSPSVISRSQWQMTPGDILFTIAGHATIEPSSSFENLRTIIDLSRVCRHWRHTLISFPNLWATIDLPCSSELLEMLLDRSEGYPLKLRINVTSDVRSHSLHLVKDNCDRITSEIYRTRTANILARPRRNYENYLDSILALFDRPAPMLEVFDIHAYGGLRMPDGFFQGAPNLQKLDICGSLSVSYQHQLPTLRLTELNLIGVRGFTSVRQLFCLLEGASNELEVLSLDLPDLSSDLGTVDLDTCQIPLNSLENMYLSLPSEALMVVLNRIRTPSDVNCFIDCFKVCSTSNLDIAPLRSFLRNIRTGPYFSLTFYGQFFRMRFGLGKYSYSNLFLGFEFSQTETSIQQLESLFANLDFSQVRSCEIGSEPNNFSTITNWKMFGSLLHHFRNLQSLGIDCIANDEVLQFLTQLRPSPGTIPCSMLSSLMISSTVNSGTTLGPELFEILVNRKKTGHVLNDLSLDVDCSSEDSNILNRLYDLVSNVTIYQRVNE